MLDGRCGYCHHAHQCQVKLLPLQMCISFFAVDPLPGVQFILAFNRDEFLARYVFTTSVHCTGMLELQLLYHFVLLPGRRSPAAGYRKAEMQRFRDVSSLAAGLHACSYCRPTQATHFWPDQDHILAGRDLVGGGTWLAVGNNGRIAFLTNLRAQDVDPDEVRVPGLLHSMKAAYMRHQ